MSDECPSFWVVGGYLYVFVISSAMLLYLFLYTSFVALQVNPFVYLIALALILMMVKSAYDIYRSLFPTCWLQRPDK